MSYRRRKSVVASAVVVAALGVSGSVRADSLYWQGGTNDLTAANYFSVTQGSNVTPAASGDLLYIIGGTANATTTPTISVGRLLIGNNTTAGGANAPGGDGTVNIGTDVAITTAGATGAPNAGVLVASGANGTLNINGGSLTVGTLLTLGYGSDPALAGNLTVNSGSLTVNANSFNLGDNPNTGGGGTGGTLTINGGSVSVKTTTTSPSFQIGIQNRSTYVQTGGTMTVATTAVIGNRNADASSFSLSGGSFTANSVSIANGAASDGYTDNITATVSGGTFKAGSINVGNGAGRTTTFSVTGGSVTATGALTVGNGGNVPDNSNVLFSGGTVQVASLSVGNTANGTNVPTNSYITYSGTSVGAISGNVSLGQNLASNTNLTFKDDAVVTVGGTVTIGTDKGTTTSLKVADRAHLSVGTTAVPTDFFVGRGASQTNSLNVTGGQVDISRNLSMGSDLATATGIVTTGGILTTHSGGTINVAANLVIGDATSADTTYNLSGTGSLTTGGSGVVGRQKGTAAMNQLGGTATFNNGLRIGDSQGTDPAVYANGTYTLSAGTLNAVAGGTSVEGLAIAPAGTGTLRVLGGDAVANVTGPLTVFANTNGGTNTGTLAYRLQPGESLTTINATGIATFGLGSALQLDFNSVKPVFGVYTALNAADVVNAGLVASIPAGWNFQITPGGNGKLLKFFAGDLNGDGALTADDYALMDRGFARQLAGGANGDLNADGTITSQDYFLIDSAYASLHPGGLDPAFLAQREAQFGGAYVASLAAAVPEPSAVALGLGGLVLVGRRRRG